MIEYQYEQGRYSRLLLTKRAHSCETEHECLDDEEAGHGKENVETRAPERGAVVKVGFICRVGHIHLGAGE